MLAERLFPQEPLALMLKDAFEESLPGVQQRMFQKVGDVSLYMAGYFQDSLSRKLVDLDYYIDMGGAAYAQVAARVEDSGPRETYLELSSKFGDLVEVLALVGDQTQQKSEQNLLRLYETWLKTRSERAAKALQEAGILPNDTIKKDWQ
jgi:hypothetical protein